MKKRLSLLLLTVLVALTIPMARPANAGAIIFYSYTVQPQEYPELGPLGAVSTHRVDLELPSGFRWQSQNYRSMLYITFPEEFGLEVSDVSAQYYNDGELVDLPIYYEFLSSHLLRILRRQQGPESVERIVVTITGIRSPHDGNAYPVEFRNYWTGTTGGPEDRGFATCKLGVFAEMSTESLPSTSAAWGDTWLAQTFTAEQLHRMTVIGLKLSRKGSPGDMTVRIENTTGGNPNGSVVWQGSVDQGDITTNNAGAWLRVTMPGEQLLSPGLYAIVIRAPGGTSPDSAVYWHRDASIVDRYTDGEAKQRSAQGIWSTIVHGIFGYPSDFLFEQYGMWPMRLETHSDPAYGGTTRTSPDRLRGGVGYYPISQNVSLEAVPGGGHSFTHWQGDVTGTTNPTSIVMNGYKYVTGVYTGDQPWLTILTQGNGTVTAEAWFPDQGYQDATNRPLEPGTWVIISAIADGGWHLRRWEGGLSGSDIIQQIQIDAYTRITAVFEAGNPELKVTWTDGGVVTPGSGRYPLDSTVTLVPVSQKNYPGWYFVRWEGDVRPAYSTTTSLDVLMTSYREVHAIFEPDYYPVHIIGSENGSVTKTPNLGQYRGGSDVTLTATPQQGYRFAEWEILFSSSFRPEYAQLYVRSTANPYVLTAEWFYDQFGRSGGDTGEFRVIARFEPILDSPTISVTHSELWVDEGSSVVNPGTYSPGTQVSVTAGIGNLFVWDDHFEWRTTPPDGPREWPITITATNLVTGEQTSTSFTLHVRNVAPTLTRPPDQEADAGEETTFALGSFADPGVNDNPWTVVVNWGDGTSSNLAYPVQGVIQGAHTYTHGRIYTAEVSVRDKDGGVSNTASFAVTVSSPQPLLEGPAGQTAFEGTAQTFDLGSFTQGTGPWTVKVNWGDGSAAVDLPVASEGEISGEHTYADDGTYAVTVSVADSNNLASETATFSVTVSNLAPTLVGPGDQTVAQGTNTFQLGSFTDPGLTDGPWTVAVDWGQGAGFTTLGTVSDQGFISGEHTYAEIGVYTVRLTVTDKDNGVSNEITFAANVNNAAPIVTAPANQTADEGLGKTFDLGSFSDPGVADGPWAVSVNWGEGAGFVSLGTVEALGPITGAHTYADNGSYVVHVTIADKHGAASSDSFTVSVANVAPTLTAPPDQTAAQEGSSETFKLGSFSDPGLADGPWTISVKWDASSKFVTLGTVTSQGPITGVHTYADNGTYVVQVKVIDKDGATSNEVSFTVSVANVAPAVDLGADAYISEGDTFTRSGSFTDPGDDGWTATVDYGDGSGAQELALVGKTFELQRTYAQDGQFTVTVTVSDDDGGIGSDSLTVHVNNVTPVVTAPAPQTVSELEPALIDLGSFADPGADAPWTVTVDWGYDGNVPDVFEVYATGPIGTRVHTYPETADGPRTVTVSVSDGQATGSTQFTVTVLEVNSPPVLEPIEPITVFWGNYAEFTAVAHDSDLVAGQPNKLTFELIGAPGGTLNPETGAFRWRTSGASLTDQPEGGYPFTVRVTDDSEGPLHAEQQVRITVIKRTLTLEYTGDTSGACSDLTNLEARTVEMLPRVEGEEQEFRFTLGGQTVLAPVQYDTSLGTGFAVASLRLLQGPGTYTLSASFTPTSTVGLLYEPTSVSATFTITPRDLTVSATGVSRVFDGTTGATVTLSTDALPDDDVVAVYTSASFADKNVGTGKPVGVSGVSIGGADAGRYNLLNTTASTTADITKATVSGSFTAQNKVYDGSTDAVITGRSLTGVIGSDEVSLTGGTATFAQENVGTWTVTGTGFALSGSDAGNYELESSTLATIASIAKATVTGSFTAQDKTYDGTVAATVVFDGGPLSGVLGPDVVTVDSSGYAATFDTKDVGSNNPVTVSGFALAGADAGNYTLSQPTGLTAAITPKSLAVTADNKTHTYNGLEFNSFTVRYDGFVPGESLGGLGGALAFAVDPSPAINPGSYAITPSGYTSANYAITYVAGTLTIDKAPTTITYNPVLFPLLKQYSDQVTLKGTLKSGSTPVEGATLSFTLGTQGPVDAMTGGSGQAVTAMLLNQAPGLKMLTIEFKGDGFYLPATTTVSYLISPEWALADYTGPTWVPIGEKASTVTVPLTVRVTDYPDSHRGDIGNANVKIMLLDGTKVVASTSWLPVTTVLDPANPTDGIVSATVTFAAPKEPTSYDVVVAVGGWYGGADITCAVVNVERSALTDHITGGGYLVSEASGGAYAADPGTKVNFGFNLKWNKNQTNIQGNANIIIRRVEEVTVVDPETLEAYTERVLKTYQIKTNSTIGMTSRGNAATFHSRASLSDVTDETKVSVAGNCRLDLWLTDGGKGGEGDMIGFALWSSSGELLSSSNWQDGLTVQQLIDGGNLTIHQAK